MPKRGRPRKKNICVIASDEEPAMSQDSEVQSNDDEKEDQQQQIPAVNQENSAPIPSACAAVPKKSSPSVSVDMEADISQLEAPTFTTIQRSWEPMLRLKWNHRVTLIGEKVLNPMIHCCDKCEKPILIYGRMIPCKHVFCLGCAPTDPLKECFRCKEKVSRVEQSGLGSVFMCTHGGSRYGNKGCRRTYLSQRDLQAHINHRHLPHVAAANQENSTCDSITSDSLKSSPMTSSRKMSTGESPLPLRQNVRNVQAFPGSISAMIQGQTTNSRTNLITVPIQDSQQAAVMSSLVASDIQTNPYFNITTAQNLYTQPTPARSLVSLPQSTMTSQIPSTTSGSAPSFFYSQLQHYQQQQTSAGYDPQQQQQLYGNNVQQNQPWSQQYYR